MIARLRIVAEWIAVGVAVGVAVLAIAHEAARCFWGAR